MKKCVLQDWVCELPYMQQGVLVSSIRGADGVVKNHPSKSLMRWLRRCILKSAFDKAVIDNPYHPGGGSYTGPSFDLNDTRFSNLVKYSATDNNERGFVVMEVDWEKAMDIVVKEFMDSQDSLPLHFYLHVVHASSIIAYQHSDERIRNWWSHTYNRMAHDMHLAPETKEQLNARLNDDENVWKADESRFKK